MSIMDRIKTLEESLREAACIGDIDIIEQLILQGININAKHAINGWTALHWAAKRGHSDIVALLLANGADKKAVTSKGETPSGLCQKADIHQLLGSEQTYEGKPSAETPLPITPNYLQHPPLNAKVEPVNTMLARRNSSSSKYPATPSAVEKTNGISGGVNTSQTSSSQLDELVLKVRVANTGDPDFIEIELPRIELTYSRLLRTCCEELGVTPTQVNRLRKLPDTIVRKDKDVLRLVDFQEIEIVVATDRLGNGLPNGGTNNYQSISKYKNQTILY